jgi:N-acetylmuramoyl-L-alanine amidase
MRLLKLSICAVLAALLAACASGPPGLRIERGIQATGQSSRVEFIVLHYTGASNERSLEVLSRHEVSSHYLISNEAPPRVYQLVDESRRAWHAGASHWNGRSWLNASSIGIEIVNAGRAEPAPGAPAHWPPYPRAQIDALRVLLADLVQRHGVKPANIVGHSDIAPQRKLDPGPMFPWKALAQAGLGRWYVEDLAAQHQAEFERDGLPDAAWVQAELARVGYETPRTGVLDAATRNVIAAFQMHYRPTRHDGEPDAQTLAILKSLP